LIKVYFRLLSENDGKLPAFTGHMVRSFFLETLRESDPHLSKKIHDEHSIKPYSVSPLKPDGFKKKVSSGIWIIEEGKNYSFYVSLLDEETARIFIRVVMSKPIEILNLGKITFRLESLKVVRKSFEELFDESKREELEKGRSDILRVRFHTPTQLKMFEVDYPIILPIPYLIFGNLVRLWNEFSKIKIDLTEFRNWVKNNVFVREIKVVSREVDLGKPGKVVGFKGKVGFLVREGKYKGLIFTLSKFAEFSNVGEKRTMGMGVVSLIGENGT